MANRYWVGGTGSWSDNVHHWATTSGGSGGVGNTPTASDDVFFDANSFSADDQEVTIPSSFLAQCKNLDATAITYSSGIRIVGFGSQLGIFGNLTIPSNFTLSDSAGGFYVIDNVSQTPQTITTNGSVIQGTVNTGDEVVTILDPLTINGSLHIGSNGTFNSNNFAVSINSIYLDNATSILNMGTSIFTTGFISTVSGATINAGTSSIISSSGLTLDLASDQTLYDVTITDGNLSFTDIGNLTAHDLTFSTVGGTMTFYSGTTTTFNIFDAVGTSENLLIIRASTEGAEAFLYATSATTEYIDVMDNHALGDIPFLDYFGIDSTGNTNWLFPQARNDYLQIVQMVGAETGEVQTINAGKDDDGTPIYYELETQGIEFGNVFHRKKISDKLVVFTKDGIDSTLQAKVDGGNYEDIEINLNKRVNIGKDIKLEGNTFNFKWFGESSESSPVLEGIYIEDTQDMGITKG